MVASSMSIGLNLPTAPPLGWNHLLVYVARVSGLDSVWAVDRWQGPIPTAMWRQTFCWAATLSETSHALFDYQVLLGSLAKSYERKTLEEALLAVPPALLGDWLLWGTPGLIAGKLRVFGEAGVRHVGFLPLQILISRRAALYGLWAIGRIARLVRNAR